MNQKLFVSPHNDDAVMFGFFTLEREKPTVLTVFDSYVQPSRGFAECDVMTRRLEDREAIRGVAGCALQFGAVRDDEREPGIRPAVRAALERWAGVEEVWLPAVEVGGHWQHNLVGEVGGEVFEAARQHRYLTYTRDGKSTASTVPGVHRVPCTGAMIRKKLLALACYRTQIEIEGLGCWPHFVRSQEEYVL